MHTTYMCATCLSGAHKIQKAAGPPKLDLRMAVGHLVGAVLFLQPCVSDLYYCFGVSVVCVCVMRTSAHTCVHTCPGWDVYRCHNSV